MESWTTPGALERPAEGYLMAREIRRLGLVFRLPLEPAEETAIANLVRGLSVLRGKLEGSTAVRLALGKLEPEVSKALEVIEDLGIDILAESRRPDGARAGGRPK